MAKIVIKNLQDTTIKSTEIDRSVLATIHSNYIDWMHACGGKGRCTTCRMIVVKGIDNLSPPTDFEQKVINLGKLAENERLACQCKLLKEEIQIEVSQENKLPHVTYSY